MPSIDIAIKNLDTAMNQLKAVLVQEGILVESANSSMLVKNQDPEAVEAYKTRQFLDIRF